MDSWFEMFIASFDDPTLILLIISAVVSLVIGVYEGRSTNAGLDSFYERYAGCIEGVAILTSVLLVAAITATQEHDKETKFQELNAVSESVNVAVVRNNGTVKIINTADVVVGDIVSLDAGDLVPADGVYIVGSDVTADESALTGMRVCVCLCVCVSLAHTNPSPPSSLLLHLHLQGSPTTWTNAHCPLPPPPSAKGAFSSAAHASPLVPAVCLCVQWGLTVSGAVSELA